MEKRNAVEKEKILAVKTQNRGILKQKWRIGSFGIHIAFSEVRVIIGGLGNDIELSAGMKDKTGEVWDRAKLMWFYSDLQVYKGEYWYEEERDEKTLELISWRAYREKDMSLTNVKRTLESAEGTLANMIADYKLWKEFLAEYPDESRRLFDSLISKAAILCRGSNEKSAYYIGGKDGEKEKA